LDPKDEDSPLNVTTPIVEEESAELAGRTARIIEEESAELAGTTRREFA
jgi:hypothetical protein